ncbi:MAG: ribose transport system substrate-binding protein [Thermoleophilaceae bacterium]|nr:ribose transport system substrate-binding protein [Thermoleophilaceae bacterium]
MILTNRRTTGSIRALAVLAALALAVAGCGSSSNSKSSGKGGGPGVAAAKARVAELQKATTSYRAPGPPLKNIKSLAGKTVWYIPITEKVEFFQAVTSGLKTALGKAGVKLRSCSGEANPSATSSCVNQAVDARAGAIILDAIPIAVAAQAFQAAKASSIPVLVTDQDPPPPGVPGAVKGIGDDKLAYASFGLRELMQGVADWIIADSNGTAKVLVTELTDSPSTQAWIEQGAIAEYKKNCPGCKTAVAKINIGQLQLVPSKISSELLRNQDTNYVQPQFDAVIQPVQAGVQQAGFANKAKAASATGLLSGLQQVKSGAFLKADLGLDYAYQGWAIADDVFRMMLGQPPVEEKIPTRLFTKDNVSPLKLTPAAEATGEWFGPATFGDMFTKLWGL